MGNTTSSRRDAIRHDQNELLYQGISYSAFGSILAGLYAVSVFGSLTSYMAAWSWFAVLASTYLIRLFDKWQFRRSSLKKSQTRVWKYRFAVGALMSSVAWSSSMWIIFPDGYLTYQVLLVLTLGGVAGGSLASLPYDKNLNHLFQTIILVSVESRLLWTGDSFSLELAIFSLFIFGFLFSCGKEVGNNYFDLLCLRQDSQQTNSTMMDTTEQMASMGFWQWDLQSANIKLSENLAKIWGFNASEASISQCYKQIHKDDRQRVRHMFESTADSDEEIAVEFRMWNLAAKEYRDMKQVVKKIYDSKGNLECIGTVQDITDIKSAESKIYRMAYFDSLTGLANRAHFNEFLHHQAIIAARKQQQFAVIYIDLDDFKGVNDSYGHECGDQYLARFAEHLTRSVRKSDLVTRLGGDEFCVLLTDISSRDEISSTTERCLEFTRQTVQINNHRIHPKLSIGISQFPKDGHEPDELLKCADLAMYFVKQNGKGDQAFFHSSMVAENMERVRIEADLRQAISNGEFELWFQPQIDILNQKMSGVEALIRWNHPVRGMIQPDLFIYTAERIGMIAEIGEWVLSSACAQLQSWKAEGLELQMAVNISSEHFTHADFPASVIRNLKACGLENGELEVEITESMSRDPEVHTRICHELRSAGVRIAIDDFGTGYSSLSVLGKLEVDTIKIDREFIKELPQSESSALMVKAIADLSLGLGYDVVAEGVETEEQLKFLQALNFPYVQGYYFSKPVLASEIPALINTNWYKSIAA